MPPSPPHARTFRMNRFVATLYIIVVMTDIESEARIFLGSVDIIVATVAIAGDCSERLYSSGPTTSLLNSPSGRIVPVLARK
ncbi:hypothetical protein BKA66DRAFT_577000 [Pyrenochaeta sp. MPI-SDFR-AT-0127]|nr:hypothetical protein BKA66DRAFT_577000 [Pyrenochaeta sp. MPI-SDFR-AT-0127]